MGDVVAFYDVDGLVGKGWWWAGLGSRRVGRGWAGLFAAL
jgi:hypothetical protein